MNAPDGLFADTIKVFLQCRAIVLTVIIVIFALSVAEILFSLGSNGLPIASAIAWTMLAFFAHAKILLPDTRDRTEDGKKISGFMLRSFALSMLSAVPVIALGILVFKEFSVSAESIDNFTVTISVTIWISSALVLSIWGTWLPAFVAEEGAEFGKAFARFPKQFSYTFFHLTFVVSPTIFVAIVIMKSPILFNSPPLYPVEATKPEQNLDPVNMILDLIGLSIVAFSVVMTAVILSRAYLYSRAVET